MATSKTLAQLRVMVRELADMETATPATHPIDNTELDARINEGLRQLYDKLCTVRGDQYYAATASASTVASQALYTFATDFAITDFYRLVRITADDGSRHVDVPTWEMAEYAALRNAESAGVNGLGSYRYRLQPTGVEIRPYPTSAGHTITAHYVPAFVELVADSDAYDGVAGWEKYGALTAAIDLLNKEESDPSGLMHQRQAIEQNIIQLAPTRDEGRPYRIQNTNRDDVHALGGGDWYR